MKTFLKEKGIKCDYAFCSGDLRNAPDRVFPENSVQQLKSICETVDVPLDKFFLVPGNHDINRDLPTRKQVVRKILNHRASKNKGYYDPEKGQIKKEDLLEIKKGESDFINVVRALYGESSDRAAAYQKPGHFLIETEDLNVVHLDSTITYNEGQDSNLVIGTDNLFSVLNQANLEKYTIILSHYSFEMLMPEEKSQVCQVLQHFGVEMWLSGHLHDVLVQEIRGFLKEFQCGNFVSDGGKSTVLIGELDLESGNGQVQCFMWQKGDGWIKNEYLNKVGTGDKSSYLFHLKPSDSMLLKRQSDFREESDFSLSLLEKNTERIYDLYIDRYNMLRNCRYGLFLYPIIAKALLPCQIDTIFMTHVVNPEDYSLRQMKRWIRELSDYLRNYKWNLNKEAIAELQLVTPVGDYEERSSLYETDFKDIIETEFKGESLQLAFVKEEVLTGTKMSSRDQKIFIDSVTILFKEKELEAKVDHEKVGMVFSLCPFIVEDFPSTRQINKEIEKEYDEVWQQWREQINEHETWLFAEEQSIRRIQCQGTSELSMSDGLTYEVLYNRRGLLSLKFERYLYLGGAHGTPLRKCVVYDLNSAKKITLDDLISLTYTEVLERIREQLKVRYPKEGVSVDELYNRIKERYHAVGDFKYYLDRNSGIFIYFDIYEIGSYSMGYMDLYLTYLEDENYSVSPPKRARIIREIPISSAFLHIIAEKKFH